jgi:hypothetical protein
MVQRPGIDPGVVPNANPPTLTPTGLTAFESSIELGVVVVREAFWRTTTPNSTTSCPFPSIPRRGPVAASERNRE